MTVFLKNLKTHEGCIRGDILKINRHSPFGEQRICMGYVKHLWKALSNLFLKTEFFIKFICILNQIISNVSLTCKISYLIQRPKNQFILTLSN